MAALRRAGARPDPLSPHGTLTFTVPKEIFPDVVKIDTGDRQVAEYKVDITAESSSGNAAITLMFKKPQPAFAGFHALW